MPPAVRARPLVMHEGDKLPPDSIEELHTKLRHYVLAFVYSERCASIGDYARLMYNKNGPGFLSVTLTEAALSEQPGTVPLNYERGNSPCHACVEASCRSETKQCGYLEEFDISRHFLIVATLRLKGGELVIHQRHPIV